MAQNECIFQAFPQMDAPPVAEPARDGIRYGPAQIAVARHNWLVNETEEQRRDFLRFVSHCCAGRHCPSSDTVSGPKLEEGTRLRASDRDYIVSRSGWRRVDLEAFVSAKPQKSQLYVPRKAKRDRAAEWRARDDAFAAQAASQGGGDQRRVESSCA